MNKTQKKLEEKLRKILQIEKLPKYLLSSNKIIPVEKDENKHFVEKIYDVVKKETNPEQLLCYSFINVLDKEKQKQNFYMISFISKQCIYPYELTRILSIKEFQENLDVIYEIIGTKIGLFPNRNILEKTFLELKKTVLIEEFLNPYERGKTNYQNWIKDYSFEEFLSRLVFSKDVNSHTDRELFEKYIELVKINLKINFLQ